MHVTMIHGIANKPSADRLLMNWRSALEAEGGLDLAAEGVTSSMVYWADVMYPEPSDAAVEESAQGQVAGVQMEDVEQELAGLEGDEAMFVSALSERLGVGETVEASTDQPEELPEDGTLERVPLPWAIKQPLMRMWLRDVHHYLFNSESEPRQGERFHVQDEIRRRFVEALRDAHSKDPEGPHLVVAHSMGTVIAYDCLKRVPECPQVDALVTLGSPLGIDEVQDRLRPGYSSEEGFPGDRVDAGWTNVFDRLDVVSALDPEISNDYRRSGEQRVRDIAVGNSGKWRHDLTKYMGQGLVRESIAMHLGIEDWR